MKWNLFLIIITISLFFSIVVASVEEQNDFRADNRVNFSIPVDWKWQEIKMNYDWMKAYLIGDPKTTGLYAIVMIVDNPVYQVPDKDILDNLSSTLMKDYPQYIQTNETHYGSDLNRPYFSISEWTNSQSDEKLTLIIAGSKKTVVYLWLSYPSENMKEIHTELNGIATSLTIF